MNNAEENCDYTSANEFHYWSMEAMRKEGWSRLGLIATLYWVLSGYGERPRRAFGVLVVMWLAFTALYLLTSSSPFASFSLSDLEYLPMGIVRDVGYILVSVALYLGVGLSTLQLLPPWWDFWWLLSKVGSAAVYSLGP